MPKTKILVIKVDVEFSSGTNLQVGNRLRMTGYPGEPGWNIKWAGNGEVLEINDGPWDPTPTDECDGSCMSADHPHTAGDRQDTILKTA